MINPPASMIKKVDGLTGKHSFQWEFKATLTVSDIWVQDGYDLTLLRLQEVLADAFAQDLDFATEDEVKISNVEITQAPDPSTIRVAMGYSN